MRNPRGRIVMPTRPIALGGAVIGGAKPGIIVFIRAASGRWCREFHRFCTFHGVHVRPVQEAIPGRPHAFEAIGSVDALERLIGHPAVVEWHYVLSTRPPLTGQGGGDVSDRVRRVINRQRLPKADRLAFEETDRRSKLSREERLDIELREAQQRAAAL